MTDHLADRLVAVPTIVAPTVRFPVSRLVDALVPGISQLKINVRKQSLVESCDERCRPCVSMSTNV
jgi:hypothetical protein